MADRPFSRRDFLKGAGAVAVATALSSLDYSEGYIPFKGSKILNSEVESKELFGFEPRLVDRTTNEAKFECETSSQILLKDLVSPKAFDRDTQSLTSKRVKRFEWIVEVDSSVKPSDKMDDVRSSKVKQETLMCVLEDEDVVFFFSKDNTRPQGIRAPYDLGEITESKVLSGNCIKIQRLFTKRQERVDKYYRWNGWSLESLINPVKSDKPVNESLHQVSKRRLIDEQVVADVNNHVIGFRKLGNTIKISALFDQDFRVIQTVNPRDGLLTSYGNNKILPAVICVDDLVGCFDITREHSEEESTKIEVAFKLVGKNGEQGRYIFNNPEEVHKLIRDYGISIRSTSNKKEISWILNSDMGGFKGDPETIDGLVLIEQPLEDQDVKKVFPWILIGKTSYGNTDIKTLELPQDFMDSLFEPNPLPPLYPGTG